MLYSTAALILRKANLLDLQGRAMSTPQQHWGSTQRIVVQRRSVCKASLYDLLITRLTIAETIVQSPVDELGVSVQLLGVSDISLATGDLRFPHMDAMDNILVVSFQPSELDVACTAFHVSLGWY